MSKYYSRGTNIKVRALYFEESTLTLEQIALAIGMTKAGYTSWVQRSYSSSDRKDRSARMYSRAKTIDNIHGKGYRVLPKPAWYTGTPSKSHIEEHRLVYAKANGLTEIPDGLIVHHIDEDKLNNNIDNLQMMSQSDHATLHHKLNREKAHF